MSDQDLPQAEPTLFDAKLAAFKKAGKAVESLPAEERASVLRALCILYEVKL